MRGIMCSDGGVGPSQENFRLETVAGKGLGIFSR